MSQIQVGKDTSPKGRRKRSTRTIKGGTRRRSQRNTNAKKKIQVEFFSLILDNIPSMDFLKAFYEESTRFKKAAEAQKLFYTLSNIYFFNRIDRKLPSVIILFISVKVFLWSFLKLLLPPVCSIS